MKPLTDSCPECGTGTPPASTQLEADNDRSILASYRCSCGYAWTCSWLIDAVQNGATSA